MALFATTVAGCGHTEPMTVKITAYLNDEVATQPAPIEQQIRKIDGVTTVDFVNKEEAYKRFTEATKDFESPKPTLGSVDVTAAYFEMTITDTAIAEVAELAIGSLDGVAQASLSLGSGDASTQDEIGVLVRLNIDVTVLQRDAVERIVREMPRTESITYETQAQAQDRLRQRSSGKDELSGAFGRVGLDRIHSSFRLRLTMDGDEKVPQISTLMRTDGVARVMLVPVEVL